MYSILLLIIFGFNIPHVKSEPKRYAYQISEECPNGTLVTSLLSNGLFYPQDSYPSYERSKQLQHSFQLLTESDLFNVDLVTGDIMTVSRIDREEICPNDESNIKDIHQSVYYENQMSFNFNPSRCRISLQILHMSNTNSKEVNGSPQKTQVILVDIFIVDINDNPPIWQDAMLNITVPEHSPIGYKIPLPTAFDPDWGPQNTTSRYYLVEESDIESTLIQAFKLEVNEVYPTEQNNWPMSSNSPEAGWKRRKFKLWLRVDKDLDHENPLETWQESNVKHRPPKGLILKLYAEDEGLPLALNSFIKLNVTITDINDQPPVFLPHIDGKSNDKVVQIDIAENIPIDRVVYQPKVFDPDPSDEKSLRFKFDNSISKTARMFFGISEENGKIFTKQVPDYEVQKEFLLPIIVTDGEHETRQTVLIKLVNENDHEPVITVQSIVDGTREKSVPGTVKQFVLSVREHQPENTLVATVMVEDADQLNLDELKVFCKIRHESFSLEPLFENAKSKFKLVTKTSFDRELAAEQFAALICQDGEKNSKSAQINLKIQILDINDHKPIFNNQPMQAVIKENSPIGTWIYKVSARDSDSGINSRIGYFIDHESSKYFTIDPHHGDVTSLRSFDMEEKSEYEILVTARDRYNPEAVLDISNRDNLCNEANTTLIVRIEDENDSTPQFSQSIYQFSVSEDAKFNERVGMVSAIDRDLTDANNQIRYSIKNEPDNKALADFRVSIKGEIFVKSTKLDREKFDNYAFTIEAKDNGSPAQSSTTQIHIHVTDVNDNAPTWIFPGEIAQSMNLSIKEPNGFRVAQLRATDSDEGENGIVTYVLNKVTLILLRRQAADLKTNDSSVKLPDLTFQQNSFIQRSTDENLFELDTNSGHLYLIRQLTENDLGTAKLFVEACDKGQPPKVSKRILTINIIKEKAYNSEAIGYGSQKSLSNSSKEGRLENDLIVIVIMVAVTLVISLILIMAILFLRCRYCIGVNGNNRMNQRNLPLHLQQFINNGNHHSEEVFRDSPRNFVLPQDLMNDSILVDYGNNTVIRGGLVQSLSGELFYTTDDQSLNTSTTNSKMLAKKSSTLRSSLWPMKSLFSFNRNSLTLNNDRDLKSQMDGKFQEIKSATIARQNNSNNYPRNGQSNGSSPIADLNYNFNLAQLSGNLNNQLIAVNPSNKILVNATTLKNMSRNRMLDDNENETSIDSESAIYRCKNPCNVLVDDSNPESGYLKLNKIQNNNLQSTFSQNGIHYKAQNENLERQSSTSRSHSKSRQENREGYTVSWVDQNHSRDNDDSDGMLDGAVHHFQQLDTSTYAKLIQPISKNNDVNNPIPQNTTPPIYNKFPTSFV